MDHLKFGIATFGLVGGGIGLSALFTMALVGSTLGRSLLGLSAIVFVVLSGPVLAALLSLRLDDALQDLHLNTAAAASAVVGAVGFFVMGLLAVIFIVLGSGGDVSFADAIVPVIVGMVAPAVVGGATPFLRDVLTF